MEGEREPREARGTLSSPWNGWRRVVCNHRHLNGGSRWGMIGSVSEKLVGRGGCCPELWAGRPAAVLPLAMLPGFGSNEREKDPGEISKSEHRTWWRTVAGFPLRSWIPNLGLVLNAYNSMTFDNCTHPQNCHCH